MVHMAPVAASAAMTRNPSRQNLPPRPSQTSGSFHAGEPFPLPLPYDDSSPSSGQAGRVSAVAALSPLRRLSTAKYHTFPTPPPAGPSENRPSHRGRRAWYRRLFRPEDETPSPEEYGDTDGAPLSTRSIGDYTRQRKRKRSQAPSSDGNTAGGYATPLPWSQLGLLALLSLAEQTALNSIGPYLPTMVASFDEIPDGQEGLYVGLLASAFALAQLTTNLLWGYLSDRMGRKPTMLLGTTLLMVCFVSFGFCTTFAQLVVVHVAMGVLNGNAAIVPTCLGEVTDRTNQSSVFTWLPVIYSLGSITGPALGGVLVGVGGSTYPFLAPNILAAAFLLSSVVVLAVWFEETLDIVDRTASGAGLEWVRQVRNWRTMRLRWPDRTWRKKERSVPGRSQGRQSGLDTSSSDGNSDASDLSVDEQQGLLGSQSGADEEDDGSKKDPDEANSAVHGLRNRNTIAVLGTYLLFQLANISFNSLYPIFASSPAPTGRDLGPDTIGVSLSLAGLVTIMFQLFVFQRLKARAGNLGAYRSSLLGMAVSMALMPWIGYLDGESRLGIGPGGAWLYGELGAILVLKNICAVGGLSSVMLLITNSAPSHETLGTVNGIAQTLSAAGRGVGPFLSGSLFTLSTRVRPKGEALAWGFFAGVTLLGWLASFAIRGKGLESAEWVDDDSDGGSGEVQLNTGV